MCEFRQDNTEGFSNAQLASMNDEFYRDMSIALTELPDGAEGADDDLLAQIRQSTAEAVLRRHGAA